MTQSCFESKGNLERVNGKINRESLKVDLKVNKEKTKVMFKSQLGGQQIKIENVILEKGEE